MGAGGRINNFRDVGGFNDVKDVGTVRALKRGRPDFRHAMMIDDARATPSFRDALAGGGDAAACGDAANSRALGGFKGQPEADEGSKRKRKEGNISRRDIRGAENDSPVLQ